MAALVLGAALTATLVTATPASASWSDPEHAGGTVAAGRVLPPGGFTCTVGNFLVGGLLQQAIRFSWTAPPATSLKPNRFSVTLSYAGGLNPPTGTYSASGTATELFVPTNTVIGIGSSTARISSHLGTWSSSPAAQTRTVSVTNVLLGVLVDCS
ncbi:hypothetical protein [Diaminobutyricimonas aerilata]|uniref:hypothetical protein n=1 Tax=Diaminobutyricimonas aerilata TaxID=1162967 RepID=UPI000C245BB8|nr:hypothetical protein [Diaminobutyricimonas aerilata]